MSARTAEPMAQMNMTPLIDVLLVLLIMFIMTIPIMTHQVAVDLPAGQPPHPLLFARHVLAISPSGTIRLDGAAVGEGELAARLRPIADDPQSLLTLDADAEARYETVDRVLVDVKHAGVTRMGFADDGRFARAF